MLAAETIHDTSNSSLPPQVSWASLFILLVLQTYQDCNRCTICPARLSGPCHADLRALQKTTPTGTLAEMAVLNVPCTLDEEEPDTAYETAEQVHTVQDTQQVHRPG